MNRSDRREFLIESAAWAATAVGLIGAWSVDSPAAAATTGKAKSLHMPGPFRGRVVEVSHPGSVVAGKANRDAVRDMVKRGMLGLTGEKDSVSAWQRFFGKGDVVGIKVNPVGNPHAISNHAVVLEIIEGLRRAG